MIGRTKQVALVLTAVLAAGAACRNQYQNPGTPGHAAPPASPAPAAAGPFTLVASGDILAHATVVERAAYDAGGDGHDFRPMLSAVQPVVSGADLALCHLATGYGPEGDPTGGPPLTAPPRLAEDLAATGYDGCSTASAHALDDGAAGVARTLDALDRAGLRHTGTARSETEARSVVLHRAGGARVAHLSYTSATGYPPPDGRPWAVNLLDPDRIIADARAARRGGADVVVVSVDWGTEGQDEPDRLQLTLAGRLTASATDGRPDIDLILGTSAHVPQAYEKVNGTWVVYGLGDQIAGPLRDRRGVQDPRGNESTLGRFTFAPPDRPGGPWRVVRAEFVPQLYDLDAGRVVDLGRAIAQGAELEGARDRIREVVLSRGAGQDGLVMAE
ncbi:CapA family protein [Streptomyces sp. SudanB182_2057]|uniref:CapA family protein n=1 Tax=Streptomyces sp. SudanB182_2057 TaxID=3035281 RepID=UPI003F556A00